MAKVKKAQKGDSLTYSTTGRYSPKQKVSIDTTGYAGGKKEFTATSELSKKPRTVGRKMVDRTINALKAGKLKKAQWGSSEGGRCGITRAADKEYRQNERAARKQDRQTAREVKREEKRDARAAKDTATVRKVMKKGGKVSKKKK